MRTAALTRPALWGWLPVERALVLGLLLLTLSLIGVALDDLRAHRALPQESAAAHAYMTAMVHNDPAGMWAQYSPSARQARGGDEVAFISFMRLGTHPHAGPTNPFTLVATVPLDSGLTLLYYRVALTRETGGSQLLVPVVINAAGEVEEAGADGLVFVTPKAPTPAATE